MVRVAPLIIRHRLPGFEQAEFFEENRVTGISFEMMKRLIMQDSEPAQNSTGVYLVQIALD